ncbi:2-oxo-4-hydroxy-4-carboxy-5-ureidoimidazoline decarboxylase [Acidiphilium sp.]|uniref:2-oxo-4-hydroxy-4-carboxy-5-ureidoimidazoline decarboxylase n=1 Tax=Acidiphilium sp. TaxID=527 RepID=UPI003D07C507
MSGLSLDALNRASERGFVEALAGVYEHSDWVAAAVAGLRPFATGGSLAAALQAAVLTAGADRQLALLRAHPELGAGGRLTEYSATEQRGAGLDRLDRDHADRLARLNRDYRQRFGFPFIIAVRGQRDTAAIITQIERRIANEAVVEQAIALAEVGKIAGFRLDRLLIPAGAP